MNHPLDAWTNSETELLKELHRYFLIRSLMSTTINLHEPPPRSDAKAFLNYQIAVMQAYAEGKPVEVTVLDGEYWVLHKCKDGDLPSWSWDRYNYRIAAPKIATGHNPGNKVTEALLQTDQGWRLLTEAEMDAVILRRKHVDLEFCGTFGEWLNNSPTGYLLCDSDKRQYAFRTKAPNGFFLPKPKTTIREWLQELPEGYRERAIKNHEDYIAKTPSYKGHHLQYSNFGSALLAAFAYDSSPEGRAFWTAVNNALICIPALALPPLPKEKKLVPWTFDTCPMPGFLIRRKQNSTVGPEILMVYYKNLNGPGYGSYKAALEIYEHSLDGGKTWLPCGTLE